MTEDANVDDLIALNIAIAEWEQVRDAPAIAHLDACLSPTLMFRRVDRQVVGKAAFMAALAGESPFTSRESRDVSVAVVGDGAVVTLLVIGRLRNGSTGWYRNIRVFFRTGAGWQLEVWFNDDLSTLLGGPGARS